MNTNFKVIGLTRLGIEPQVYKSRSRRSIPLGHLIGINSGEPIELTGQLQTLKVGTSGENEINQDQRQPKKITVGFGMSKRMVPP